MTSIYDHELTRTERNALAKHTGHTLAEEIDLLRVLVKRELAETADIDNITKAIDSITRATVAHHKMQTKPDDALRLAFLTALNELDGDP